MTLSATSEIYYLRLLPSFSWLISLSLVLPLWVSFNYSLTNLISPSNFAVGAWNKLYPWSLLPGYLRRPVGFRLDLWVCTLVSSRQAQSLANNCVDPSFGFLTVSPVCGVSGNSAVTRSYFRDLPLLLQQPEAFPQTVLWYTPLCLHSGLNPVPPSTFAPEVFSLKSCGLDFSIPSVLAFSSSCLVTQTLLLVSYPRVRPQDFNGFDLLRCFADLLLSSIATGEKATLASYSFSRCGLSWFVAYLQGFLLLATAPKDLTLLPRCTLIRFCLSSRASSELRPGVSGFCSPLGGEV